MKGRGRLLFFAFVLVAIAAALGATISGSSAQASTPPTSSVTVPSTTGQTVRDQPPWGGTVLPGANATSDCTSAAAAGSPVDEHTISVTVPAGLYSSTFEATFRFNITWTPNPGESDLILTVVGPDGEVIDSSDGGQPTETVTATNLPGGNYKMLVCAFASGPLPQDYQGKLEITTAVPAPSLPSAPAQGLEFGNAVAADNQRDESEPLIEISKSGHIFDCGPTGFSNAAEYAQVSTVQEGGDQFHLLGIPPRGQIGLGGGGDCALAFGLKPNPQGNYQVAYSGLGGLTGFSTSTSSTNGRTWANAGPNGNGLPVVTSQGALADRQWLTFVDDPANTDPRGTVLLSYNQQQPRNVVIQKSTNGGLTYSPVAVQAARNPRFPGPLRYIEPSAAFPQGVVYFPWDRAAGTGDQINLSISQDRGATWTSCKAAVAPGTTTLFVTGDHDRAGNIYLVYGENVKFHTYLVTLTADKIAGCNQSVTASSALPTVNPGFSQPVQVDRDAVRSTVFQWVTAGGEPGRVAVVFAGTETDGNPNSGHFKATWDIYVNQSLNALSTDPASPPTFSQVKATTHPFHYDSICLNGLGCDLSVPPGDRSMADFFSLDTNPVDGKLYVTFNRANKKPDEELGHVASPMVLVQTAGPSLLGGTIGPSTRPLVRTSSADPTGDALASYSTMAPGVEPGLPSTTNVAAGDFLSASIGPEVDFVDGSAVKNGGFTVTLKVANLSTTALTNALSATGSSSLLWIWRFTNGHQDVAASARWNPAQGFTFGYNDYTTAPTPCAPGPDGTQEKCIVYPGDQPIQGHVDQATGTIRLAVPRFLLKALSGPTGHRQRPGEVPATVGSRFYDGTAFSLGNASPTPAAHTFLYPLDNTPSMDFLLPGDGGGGGGGGGGVACKVSGGGSIAAGKFTISAHGTTPPKGNTAYRDPSTDFNSKSFTQVSCSSATTARIEGEGSNNGEAVTFTLDVVDNGESGTADTYRLELRPGGIRTGTLTKGNIQVHKQ